MNHWTDADAEYGACLAGLLSRASGDAETHVPICFRVAQYRGIFNFEPNCAAKFKPETRFFLRN